jgi:hypothetical protein
MNRKLLFIVGLALTAGALSAGPRPADAEDLLAKSCTELMRRAQTYQQDLKTVDTVLGSAIDAGSLERIRSYKLRRGAVKAELKAVLRALDVKGCVASR